MTHVIIALAGRAGSGKDTAAAFLAHAAIRDGYGATTTGFASPLKAGLSAMFGFQFADLTREEKEAPLEFIGKSPRELMQTLGTEWGRGVHQELWIQLMERRIFERPTFGADDLWILTDCRFPNELAWVRRKGGVTWWIERDGVPPVASHSSENSIGPGDCDRVIANFGSRADLAIEVQRAWAQHEATIEVEA